MHAQPPRYLKQAHAGRPGGVDAAVTLANTISMSKHIQQRCLVACTACTAELAEAAAAGIPVSPSLSGPHPEEQLTQMEVFLKQYKYPEHKCFLL